MAEDAGALAGGGLSSTMCIKRRFFAGWGNDSRSDSVRSIGDGLTTPFKSGGLKGLNIFHAYSLVDE